MLILRWQRTGLLDAYPGTLRQVRSGRHGLSQTSVLTVDVASSAEGLGESEVVVSKGKVAGLVTGRSGDAYSAIAAPVLGQFLEEAKSNEWRSFRARRSSPGRTSRTLCCASRSASRPGRPGSG